MSLVKLMLRNKVKSAVYLSATLGSLGWFYDYSFTSDVLKNSCRRAAQYGEEKLANPNDPVRHITVILNPVANKRRSKKLYTKWVEPLFHLAGIKVSLIETEKAGQEFNLMEIMSNCDGVALVGGDGTVHDAINGLLSRPDNKKAAEQFPIGIIPAGQNNSIARYIHQNNMVYRNQKEFLINATMRVIDSCQQKFDVIKIDSDCPSSQSQKPIYALRDIRYGLYQDNFFKVSGYRIYQKYIKPVWLRIKPNGKPPKIEKIQYTEADSRKQITLNEMQNVTDFRACMMGGKRVRLSLARDREYNPSEVVETADVSLKVAAELDKDMTNSLVVQAEAETGENKKEEDKEVFLIDGQPNQVHSVKISAVESALTVFTGPHKIIIPKKPMEFKRR